MNAQTTAVLVVVAGEAGSGKNRFGEVLAERSGACLVQSVSGGPLRHGIDPADLPDAEEYATLLQTAKMSLDAGSSVVLVAPFHTIASRKAAMKLASEIRCALLYVECSANEAVRRRRLKIRFRKEGLGNLEAHLDAMVSNDKLFQSVVREIPRACQMMVDTTVGIELWAGLAASRVETYLTAENAPPVMLAPTSWSLTTIGLSVAVGPFAWRPLHVVVSGNGPGPRSRPS